MPKFIPEYDDVVTAHDCEQCKDTGYFSEKHMFAFYL